MALVSWLVTFGHVTSKPVGLENISDARIQKNQSSHFPVTDDS